MNIILFILLVSLVKGQEIYEKLINEKVTEDYCNKVIDNMVSILNEGYVYLDFLKAPKQPEGYDDYFPKVDLIAELNAINKTDRLFYEFYRDIENVLEKTRDGHFNIYAIKTPNNIYLNESYFCIPYNYSVFEVFDEQGEVNDTYLTIQPKEKCKEGYSEEILKKLNELKGKKILEINGMGPYEYLDDMAKKGIVVHSPQARYIYIQWLIDQFPVIYFPFYKEELNVSIQFENEDELFNITYIFLQNKTKLNSDFQQFLEKEQEKSLKYRIPLPSYEKLERKYKIKQDILNNNLRSNAEDIWDLKSKGGEIKCKVDNNNQLNVLYQNSFASDDFDDYEKTMYECFSRFYSNNNKIVIIEDENGGGYSELCIPFTQYLRPKILKPDVTSMRSTNLIYKNFFLTDENLNPETCFPYTEEDNILDGYIDKYSDDVYHNRTKNIESFNIYEKKIMEIKRREYLKTQNTKKPTEIIVFTDGYSFSCTSTFIKGLQVHGAGIIVGYNSRPDLVEEKYDASQSNSAVETFRHSEYIQNLEKLGFKSSLTFCEEFDPNDKNEPKIPMEFQIYPVDEISNIFVKYDDDKYERFIKEAKRIFNKYNDLENTSCNPNNTLLFYETDDCDLKIEHAHGGYLCGDDGKWNKNKCIAAYCDQGYILNDERNKCIEDPCEQITLHDLKIKEDKDSEYVIEPNNTYIFTIENDKNTYKFDCELEPFFYVLNDDHILEAVNKEKKFKNKDKIYVNYYVNTTQNYTIKLKVEKNNDKKDDDKMPTWAIILIIVLSVVIALVLIVAIIMFMKSRKKEDNEEDKPEKNKELLPV